MWKVWDEIIKGLGDIMTERMILSFYVFGVVCFSMFVGLLIILEIL